MQERKSLIPVSFILRVVAWLLLNFSLFYSDAFYTKHPVLQQIAYALNLFLTTSVLISIGKFIIVAIYNRRHAAHKVRGNFVLGINRLAAILNVIFLILALMIAFGINPKEFITSMTIVAMAIAVIFREYITNMISGLIIMFSDQFSIGDHIRVGEHSGKIIDITFSSLVILNEEDDRVLIPSNLVFTGTFINKSAQFSNKITVRFELPFSERVEAQELKARLEPMIKNIPDVVSNADILIRVAELGKDFVRYKVDLLAIDNSNRRHKRIESDVLNAILSLK